MDTETRMQEYINKARKARAEWRYQDILDICAEAEEKGIVHPRLIAAKSFALIGLKRYPEAQGLLEKSLEEYPDDPTLHYNLANLYYMTKRRSHARKEASKVLELLGEVDPEEIDEQLSVAKSGSLMILHRFDEATRFLEYEVARFPESTSLHTQLANVYMKRKHLVEATKQVKLIPGKQNRDRRRRLILMGVSPIVYLILAFGLIVYFDIIHLNFLLILLTIVLLGFVVIMINRPKFDLPPDRSGKESDESL